MCESEDFARVVAVCLIDSSSCKKHTRCNLLYCNNSECDNRHHHWQTKKRNCVEHPDSLLCCHIRDFGRVSVFDAGPIHLGRQRELLLGRFQPIKALLCGCCTCLAAWLPALPVLPALAFHAFCTVSSPLFGTDGGKSVESDRSARCHTYVDMLHFPRKGGDRGGRRERGGVASFDGETFEGGFFF